MRTFPDVLKSPLGTWAGQRETKMASGENSVSKWEKPTPVLVSQERKKNHADNFNEQNKIY